LKILITGMTGFVGRHLTSLLLKEGYNVGGIIRSNPEKISKEITLHKIDDLLQADFKQITQGYDVVIHLAALVHQPKVVDLGAYMQLNYDATLNLAQACLENGISKFVVLSTCAVYEGLSGSLLENRALLPQTPYAKSKYKATLELQTLFESTAMNWFVLRPPLIYGKAAKGNMASLSSMIKKLPFVPFKMAKSPRSYISITNLCSFILYLLQNTTPSGVYNISDDHDLSTQQLCDLIAKAQEKTIVQLPVPKFMMKALFTLLGRSGHYDKIYSPFNLNIEKALATGWKPKAIDYRDFII
jgi:UDP-glucose 4-epimerase